jgi:hypothetical protein
MEESNWGGEYGAGGGGKVRCNRNVIIWLSDVKSSMLKIHMAVVLEESRNRKGITQ